MRATDAAMVVFALALIWSFYRAQRNPGFAFDLFDLVMENGRLSKTSIAFVSTLLVTSWIMIRLTLDGKLTEGYFTGYAVAWIAPLVAKLFSPPTPAGTTTTSKTTTSTVDVQPKDQP